MAKRFIISIVHMLYRGIFRPFLFLFHSEFVHERALAAGAILGASRVTSNAIRGLLAISHPSLTQKITGIHFENPIGLAAGFDYDARLPHMLPALGFGFGTVGTITNKLYEGNPPPRLGRLVKSQSLLVNKGFKNAGIKTILERCAKEQFEIPIGLSIGKTNSPEIVSQKGAIADILEAFRAAESSPAPFSHYELNISCPNLSGNVEFYTPEHLRDLLTTVTALKLKKPLFIKMPIEKEEREVEAMLDVITTHPVQGIIIGNVARNRSNPALDPEEVKHCTAGNFSGKPTQKSSDELIRFAYRKCGTKLTIIGCGGVFSAEDAYRKIRLGASLIQLITGLIFEGPQLPTEINLGLMRLLERDGFQNLTEAIGKNV